MEGTTLNIDSDSLSVCDMRPGFTEDEVELALPKGQYELSVFSAGSSQGFQLLLKNIETDDERLAGKLSLDGACVGVFDKPRFLDYFQNDFGEIYEWSSDQASSDKPWGEISHEIAGLGLYVQTYSDCICDVIALYAKGSIVGFKVTPNLEQSTNECLREWSWVTIKCKGMYRELRICHDRDYELELEDVIEEVLSDLCTIEDEDSIDFIDQVGVDIGSPITSYRPEFTGIDSIVVSYQKSEDEELIDRAIYPDIEDIIKSIDPKTSTKELAQCVFKILKRSETMS